MRKKTFEQWLAEVEQLILDKTGLDRASLVDAPYYDWYQARVSPATAAKRAIRNDGTCEYA